jgi:acetylornithine/N-succinyldiaminopimelate aminotransferase
VIALAKALGGGVPIGAMLCQSTLEGALPPGSHGSTFGGNALASAAALAVLQALEQDGLLARVRATGERLAAGLSRIAERHRALVACARGKGLLQALVLKPEVDARAVLGEMQRAGLLVTIAGGQALRFSPPLVVSDGELDEALEIADRVLSARA